MYNERLKKFIEQIKQKNIETNQADVQGTNGESVFGRVREKETLNNKQNSKTKYIYEDKSRRSANARCYRTEKGETETVISGEAVNYYNCKEKKYRQIDNTLEYRSDKTCDRDFAGYENRYNSFKVRFAEKSASSDLMRVEKDGYELYVKLFEQNLTIRNNAVINRRYNNVSSILQESREKINPLVSGIRYNELYDGVDFEYEVSSTQIKENITIKTKRENHSFAFKIYSKGLIMREKSSGKEIEIVAEETHENTKAGDIVFTMPSGYMYDQKQMRSDNVYYQLQEITRGEYILQIKPDEKWLSSEERVFPVVIDPNLVVNGDEDNLVYKIVKNYNKYSGSSYFYREEANNVQIGYYKGSATGEAAEKEFGETELYIGLKNVDEIYDGIVNDAVLIIPIYSSPLLNNSSGYFEVHGIIADEGWMNREIEWNTKPEYDSTILAFAKPIEKDGRYSLKLDITTAWAGKYSGFVVKGSDLGKNYVVGMLNSIYIPNQKLKQNIQIAINYIDKDQIQGGKSIQQPCNQAGTGAIDLFTGDITFVHEDINLEGVQLPINIEHIYNSRYYDIEADETYKCGVGWRLNILQTLKEEPDSESEDPDFKSYIYIDASGIKHNLTTRYYKNLKSDDDTREFKIYGSYKEGEKDWDDTEISDGTYILTTGTSQNTLTDTAGNKLKFNVSDGRLTELENPDGLTMKIEYNENSIVVSDFNDRKITLEFSENKQLEFLKLGTKIVRSYLYWVINSKKYLVLICGDFISINFEYINNRYLYKVTDPSKYIIEYKVGTDKTHLCGGYSIKSKRKEISYNTEFELDETENAEEQILDEITITYNSEFNIDSNTRFNGHYSSYNMDNMTKVENKAGAEQFYVFNFDGSLSCAFDGKLNQSVSYKTNKTSEVLEKNLIGLNEKLEELDKERWKRSEITQTNASVLSTALTKYNGGKRQPVNMDLGCSEVQSEQYISGNKFLQGGYVFTAIISGNIVSGEAFESLTDETAKNTSYVVVKIVKHLSGNIAEEYFARVHSVNSGVETDRIVCLPFFVDDTVTGVDISVEIKNNPNYVSVPYCDVLLASEFSQIVSHDKDYGVVTSYKGKYGTESKTDLSKRTNLTKRTTTLRKGARNPVTAISTYQSKTSERIVTQDDGISLMHSYTYDGYGNIQKEEVRDRSNATLKMKREYSYADSSSNMNHNALFSETDENGNRIKYDYESSTGLLKRTTLPGTNQNIDYAYSGIEGILTKITARANELSHVKETSNNLSYNLGYLTKVEHNSGTYYFTYDGFGRITKVSLGNITLIETVYTDNGVDIDEVAGATSKVVTSYNNAGAIKAVFCGTVLCGQTVATSFFGNRDLQNEVFVSYYNKYGELIKVRHASDHALDQPLGAENDYITVTDFMDSITYVMGTKKYIYDYDSYTGELQDYSEFEDEKLNIKFENKSNDENEAKDVFGRSKGVKFTLDNGEVLEYTYTYKSDYEDVIDKVMLPSRKQSSIQTDVFGRLTSRTVNTSVPMSDTYTYKANGSYTTPLVEKETLTCGNLSEEYRYTYDANNNVTQIRNIAGELLVSYEYDGLNRLIREDVAGVDTTLYVYDKSGNIQSKNIFDYKEAEGRSVSELLNYKPRNQMTYGYNIAVNDDLLSSYNGSESLWYDDCGMPLVWFKHGEKSSCLRYLLQWSRLRLTRITDMETGKIYLYTYNDQGIRTEKVIDGIRHKYYLHGEQIIAEKIGDKYIKYYYDGTGICGFNYDGTDYYYQKNIFGDILKIYDGNGKVYGEYGYTAWGKCRIKANINGIGEINPFRYRGYYYDEEISLYYLNARYYDPEVGRFISADSMEYLSPESINGLNLYAYCGNNPVMNMDPSGCAWWEFWKWDWAKIGMIAVSVVEVAAGIATIVLSQGAATEIGIGLIGTGVGSIMSGYINEAAGGKFAAGWHGGQVAGLVATFIPISSMGAALGGFVGSVVTDIFNHKKIDWGNAVLSGVISGLFGKISGTFTDVIRELGKEITGQLVNGLNIFAITFINSLIDYFRGVPGKNAGRQ